MPLNNCNKAQLEAVKHFLGPMLLIAGPGSGKTFTIIERIRYLIEQNGVEPSQILVITFTKAAALEMQQRFLTAMKGRACPVNFGTFHAVYFHILKQAYQYNSQNIISEEEKREYLNYALKNIKDDSDEELCEHLLNEFGKVKNSERGIEGYFYEGGLLEKEEFSSVYKRYKEICTANRKMDFDDMAIQCLELFRRKKEILKNWQKRFSFVMIDEFQDINAAQYAVVKLLAGDGANLLAVGDDDQSIYGFRGASPSIMQKFLKDFPRAKTVMLNQNYRCAGKIIKMAMTVIKENENRFSKEIVPGCEKKGEVTIKGFPDKEKEYEELLQLLKELQKQGKLKECAVIFRTNKGVWEMKKQLEREKIPFEGKRAEPLLFEHFIMKDIEDYIRFAMGERKRKRFLRFVNKPSRYISRESMEKEDISFSALRQYYKNNPAQTEKLAQLEAQLAIIKDLPPFLAVNYIRKAAGYDTYLAENKSREEKEELLKIADRIQESASAYRTMEDWLEMIEEQRKGRHTRQTQGKRENETTQPQEQDRVVLTTMHGAKGLEYETVILPEINEGTVPYGRMLSKEQEEEERRIFYVAMTRAKSRLYMFYVENEITRKSRFL